MRHGTVLIALWAGCLYEPPDLPFVDEVPIETPDGCAPRREEFIACVIDGDTFDLRACGEDAGERVRLLGINAPEIAHDEPAECFGDRAHSELRQLIEGRTLLLSFDEECLDLYGRTLAYAWIAESTDEDDWILVNEWMLREGYARTLEGFIEGLRLEDRLLQAEAEAQAAGRGLWGACDGDTGA